MDDLGARLLAAQLITRDVLREAAADRRPMPEALVSRGLAEEMLLSFLMGEGHAPCEPEMVFSPDPDAISRVPGLMAHRLQLLPVRTTEDGLEVAMVDPSDRHAVREVALTTGSLVVARVARLSVLRAALHAAYPDVDASVLDEREDEVDAIALELTRPKTPTTGRLRPLIQKDGDGGFVPLVRTKSLPRAAEIRRPSRRFGKPPGVDSPRVSDVPDLHSAPEPGVASRPESDRPSPPDESGSIEIDVSPDSWRSLDEPETPAPSAALPPTRDALPTARIRRPERPISARIPGDIGTTIAQMRTFRDRDTVLTLACEAALLVARAAVFLALRGGVLRGWMGRGGALTPDAIRNLWIPTTTPSMFKGVVTHGVAYAGSYGTHAADNLFRAATGSRGGQVVICPVEVMGKRIAAFVADDVRYGDEGKERIEALAEAVGDSFKRIILARKRD